MPPSQNRCEWQVLGNNHNTCAAPHDGRGTRRARHASPLQNTHAVYFVEHIDNQIVGSRHASPVKCAMYFVEYIDNQIVGSRHASTVKCAMYFMEHIDNQIVGSRHASTAE